MSMNNKKGHLGSDGSNPKERIEVYGVVSEDIAENLIFSPEADGSFLILLQYVNDGMKERI